MEVLIGMAIALGGILLIILFRSLTTLFHEMGHALPALWFTNEPVEVFVGSYGDLLNSWQLKLGRLRVVLRWNPFDWQLGVCRHQGAPRIWQTFLIILGGPLASTLIAAVALWISLHYQLSEAWLALIAIFAGSALIDLFVNLTPSASPINMYDGGTTYSDGFQLQQLFAEWRLPQSYLAAREAFLQKEYETSLVAAEELISQGDYHPFLYSIAIESLIKLKRFAEVLGAYEHYQQRHELVAQDYVTIASAYQQMNNFSEALKHYNSYLYDNYTDSHTIYKRAQIYVELASFEEALEDLNRAVFLQKDNPKLYALRSLCHLKTKQPAAAWDDIIRAEELDASNNLPEIPYYKGLYYEAKGLLNEALEAYELAKKKGISFHGIDYKIVTIENSLRDFSK